MHIRVLRDARKSVGQARQTRRCRRRRWVVTIALSGGSLHLYFGETGFTLWQIWGMLAGWIENLLDLLFSSGYKAGRPSGEWQP